MVKPPLETEIASELMGRSLPPLQFHLLTEKEYPKDISVSKGVERPDAVLEACAERMPAARFAVEYKRQWTPKILVSAVASAEQYAKQSGLHPLVVVPYLSDERLLELEERSVSGLDLCGNGVIVVPGKYTVFRGGRPNRFKTSAPIKNIYRGSASLVARAFLIQPVFTSVNALTGFVIAHDSMISRATVSKALRGMEDDLLISRQNGTIRIVQPDKLLSLLEKNFNSPDAVQEIVGRSPLPLSELRQMLAKRAGESGIAISATGVSSAPRYATLAMEEQIALYCRDLASLLEDLPFEETKRFPNLKLIETRDPVVFFDSRPDMDDYPWASPIQTYLEMATGEPRLKQSAQAVREEILRSIRDEETK